MTTNTTTRTDIYTRVTNQIVEQLERGVRPWLKPWNAEHAAGRITRPLRHSGEPYKGINILMLAGGLKLAATLLTRPGKIDIGGEQVQSLFIQKRLDEIVDYCTCDVLDIFCVFAQPRRCW